MTMYALRTSWLVECSFYPQTPSSSRSGFISYAAALPDTNQPLQLLHSSAQK
ncbi:hypothetical protein Scep_025072 [Stephania cephalantha]|uniref:Uncharacterized protein n=1 Tax=Stephania cephalantha TaxID=152367 RepID=A0AAP0F387_9MAGN